jgi:hypothetical protein
MFLVDDSSISSIVSIMVLWCGAKSQYSSREHRSCPLHHLPPIQPPHLSHSQAHHLSAVLFSPAPSTTIARSATVMGSSRSAGAAQAIQTGAISHVPRALQSPSIYIVSTRFSSEQPSTLSSSVAIWTKISFVLGPVYVLATVSIKALQESMALTS